MLIKNNLKMNRFECFYFSSFVHQYDIIGFQLYLDTKRTEFDDVNKTANNCHDFMIYSAVIESGVIGINKESLVSTSSTRQNPNDVFNDLKTFSRRNPY